MKSVRIRNFSGLYSVPMRKNTDQKNSEYGQISGSVYDRLYLGIMRKKMPKFNILGYFSSIRLLKEFSNKIFLGNHMIYILKKKH